MAKKGSLTKVLAVVGTVLVWIPMLAPILVRCGFSHPGSACSGSIT